MTPALPPEDEPQRLQALRDLHGLVDAASIVCDTPIALVSLIDQVRQWCVGTLQLLNQIVVNDLGSPLEELTFQPLSAGMGAAQVHEKDRANEQEDRKPREPLCSETSSVAGDRTAHWLTRTLSLAPTSRGRKPVTINSTASPA